MNRFLVAKGEKSIELKITNHDTKSRSVQ